MGSVLVTMFAMIAVMKNATQHVYQDIGTHQEITLVITATSSTPSTAMEDHMKAMEDPMKAMEDHMKVMEDHMKAMEDHMKVMRDHMKVMEDHMKVMEVMTAMAHMKAMEVM